MDRLMSLEPSNQVAIRVEPGQRSVGELTLRNVMYTMPVAFRLHPVHKSLYAIHPHSGVIHPLATVTVEIAYLGQSLPESYPNSDDSFILQSVVVPGAAATRDRSLTDSVPSEWFTNRKKQVFSDSGIRIFFVGSAVLTRLVRDGSMDGVREVLERSDPAWRCVESADSDGSSLLHLAVDQARPDLVQLLLEFDPDVESTARSSGRTALESASAAGEALIVELLLAHRARATRSATSELGPLQLASRGGHLEVMRLLLLKGADANEPASDGRTALHLAAEERRRDCARLLLASGAAPDVRGGADGETPLHVAAAAGDEHMVRLLMARGANKDVRSLAGKTAYDVAAEGGHARLFDALRLGDRLCAAARKGDLRAVQRLVEMGASVDGRDQHGWTALHRAGFKGRADVVKALLDKGADASARDGEGYAPLHCAVEAGQAEAVELLVKRGADVEARTNKGATPLRVAESLHYAGIVRILVNGGATRDRPTGHVGGLEHAERVIGAGRDRDVKKKRGVQPPASKGGVVRGRGFDRSTAPLAC
ncbi:hypothetical protein QJS10_CPB19g01218 [Acorus calamus]|uniref:MSP domain-containing protein n=1 Tax=Acorus calamus TaxID=4465 RepID=A0AAV9CEH9_ACOCL|nr:hypothetical protein QJS10_CPB19g01218 [Acorus calamus]